MFFFKSLVALGFAALGLAAPATSNSTSLNGRIVRGGYVQAHDAPFYCALYQIDESGNRNYRCGASIIAEQTILSSAECFEPNYNYAVKCGTNSLLGGPYDFIPIESFIRHPGYGKNGASDTITDNIALGFVKNKIQCSERVQIAELCSDPLTSSNYRVFGFGSSELITQEGEWTPSYALKYIDHNLIDDKQCFNYFRKTLAMQSVPRNTFCASGNDPHGTNCQGGQGGPLIDMATSRQCAVASYISPYCAVERPAIYTDIVPYIDWIVDNKRPLNFPTVV